MDDESSDILGQRTKPAPRGNKNNDWLGASLTVKLALGLAIVLALYVVVMRIWFRILVWKERSYKLAMRRRHGIPDNDHRPFNVAYAAVVRARQEKEAAQKAKVTQLVPQNDRRSAQTGQDVRQRFGLQTTADVPRASSYSTRLPGAYFTEGTPARSHLEPSVPPAAVSSSRYPSQAQQISASRPYENGTPSYLNGYRRMSRKDLDLGGGHGGQKRGYDEDLADEQEATKRSKQENGFIGNEAGGAVWQDQVPPQRVAKRYLFDEGELEDGLIEHQPRDKRARKVSLDKCIQAQEEDLEMDVDEDEDDIDDLPYIQRGKKRDRTEAGSTFGGDDDESDPEQDGFDHKPRRRGRKRRTFSKRKSDAAIVTRGQKRDRDMDENETNFETGDENSYEFRKKRGKRAPIPDDELSEQSTTQSQTSSNGRNRKIGEEWTSNGIRWRVGVNGQRLRQALVKKARQRFPMPEDSQHPDREADFEVYVETWLTEEEYRDAKTRHILAGQDAPKRLEPKLGVDVQTHVNGKNLLWSSTSTPFDSPVSHSPVSERTHSANQRISRISFSSSGSPRTNPFDQIPSHTVRRISSISRTSSVGNNGSPSLADSTNSSPRTRFRTYSKFEKQELEAQALMKLRELKSKKEAEISQAKEDEAAKEKENLDKANTTTAIPTITVTAPTEAPKPATQPTPSLFSVPKPSEDASKTAELPKSSNLFNFPATPTNPSTDTKPEAPKPPLFGPSATPTTTSTFPSTAASIAPKADDKTTAPFSLVPPTSAASSTGQMSQPVNNFFAPSTIQASTGTNLDQTVKPTGIFDFPSSSGATTSMDTASTPWYKPSTGKEDPQPAGGNNPLLSRLGPSPDSAAPAIAPTSTSTSSQSSSLFNFSAKPPTATTAASPNLFATPPSQSSQPTTAPAASNPATNPASGPLKFNFGLTGPSNTSSTSAATGPAAPSGSPFDSVMKGPSTVAFTPLTPDGGTKDNNKPVTSDSTTPKTAPDPSAFGFKAPATFNSNNNLSKPSGASVFGVPNAAPNPFATASSSSNPATVFGSTAFGAKPAENKPAESSTSNQTAKPLFNFGVTGGQPSSSLSGNAPGSQSGGNLFGSSSAAAKSAPSSSSLFNALGNQSTSVFGSTSTPNATNASILGSSNANASSISAPTNVFGAQPTSSLSQDVSGNQPTNAFGISNTGATGIFGATSNKPAETPKSVFSAPNGTTMTTTSAPEQSKSLFQFKPSQPSSSTSTNPLASTTSNSGPTFKFNFDFNKNTSSSSSSQPSSVFGAPASGSTSTSAFALKPSPLNTGTPFGSTGSGSTFNPLGAASQPATFPGQK